MNAHSEVYKKILSIKEMDTKKFVQLFGEVLARKLHVPQYVWSSI